MNSTLEDLFHGNILPADQQKFNKKLMNALSESEAELFDLLNEKGKKLLLSFVKNQFELNAETAIYNFQYGFKLGCRLIVESLNN